MCPVRSCPPVFTMSTLYCLQTADHLMDRGLSRNRLAPTVTSVSVCVGVLSVFPATISHGKYWVCCRCSMLAMWGEVRGRTNFPWCDLLSLVSTAPRTQPRKHQRVTTRRHWVLQLLVSCHMFVWWPPEPSPGYFDENRKGPNLRPEWVECPGWGKHWAGNSYLGLLWRSGHSGHRQRPVPGLGAGHCHHCRQIFMDR